jgi:hypothetical protein
MGRPSPAHTRPWPPAMRRVAGAQIVGRPPRITSAARRRVRQNEYPCQRRLDNYKAVVRAIATKELGFPKQTDGKRMVKEWRASRSPNTPSLPAAQTRVITR